jgi:hypothetical protein
VHGHVHTTVMMCTCTVVMLSVLLLLLQHALASAYACLPAWGVGHWCVVGVPPPGAGLGCAWVHACMQAQVTATPCTCMHNTCATCATAATSCLPLPCPVAHCCDRVTGPDPWVTTMHACQQPSHACTWCKQACGMAMHALAPAACVVGPWMGHWWGTLERVT